MCRMLSELLGASEPVFSVALRHLEQQTGRHAVDIRLSSDINSRVRLKVGQLLPYNTNPTPLEVYAALLHKVGEHDKTLVRALGGADPLDADDVLRRVVKAAQSAGIKKECWALKTNAAKQLLRKQPPKRTMKLLGYKSLDSMLKREQLSRLFAAVRLAESPKWLATFEGQYEALQPSDFETREIEIVAANDKKWQRIGELFVAMNRHSLIVVKELGTIVVLPLPVKRMQGVAITLLPQIIHHIDELRTYATYLKLRQTRPDFGRSLGRALFQRELPGAHIADHDIEWPVLHRYFAANGRCPGVLEPHIQPEDLSWRHAGRVLADWVPDCMFWHDLDYVGMADGRGGVISFNLADAAINYCNKLPMNRQANYHMRDALWNEILTRYVGLEYVERQVLDQLNSGAGFLEGAAHGPLVMEIA